MKKNIVVLLFILITVIAGARGAFAVQSADPVQAGVAAAVEGEVTAVTPPDKTGHALKSGDKVFMGDTVTTGAAGRLQILLLDETVFTLGPSGRITVDEFVYDPATDDGKVKASMAKGIFRVVSGKIAHKKPENMTVDLPAGAIGFRGTNVAGIIDGQKTTVVLLGPVGVGRIFVTNIVNGEVVAVDINEAGYATIVDGPNSMPLAVFQVSEAELNQIAGALGSPVSGGEASTTGDIPSGGGQDAGRRVDTQQLLDLLNTVDDLNQTTTTAAQDHAQQAAGDQGSSSQQENQDHRYKTV